MKRHGKLLVLMLVVACAPQFRGEALGPLGLPCGPPGRVFPAVALPPRAQLRVAACSENTSQRFTGRLARATRDTLYLWQPRVFGRGRVVAVLGR